MNMEIDSVNKENISHAINNNKTYAEEIKQDCPVSDNCAHINAKEESFEYDESDVINQNSKLSTPEKSETKEEQDFGHDEFIKKYSLREKRQNLNYRIPTVHDLPNTEIETIIVQCPQCKTKYDTCSKLRAHMRREHKITYTCLQCEKTFNTNVELIEHKKIHNNENHTYLCHKCKQAFSDHCDYLIHELTHSNSKQFCICPECGMYFKRKTYAVHIPTHFRKMIKCPICSKDVNGERYLKSHINNIHNSEFKCVECGTILHEKRAYNQHMAIHTGVKVHQCLYCGKGFRLAQQKNIHTRIHTQERLFNCKICNKTFITRIDLQRHSVLHDRERKIPCKVCNKKFRLQIDLACHMRTHSKEYNCPECDTNCSSIAGLKCHILYKHTTHRPEVCKLCNLKFINKNQLSRHCRSKSHKNNEYKAILEKLQSK